MKRFNVWRMFRLVAIWMSPMKELAVHLLPRVLLFLIIFMGLNVWIGDEPPLERLEELFRFCTGMAPMGMLVTVLVFVIQVFGPEGSMGMLLLPASRAEKYVSLVVLALLAWGLFYVLNMLVGLLVWGLYSAFTDPSLFGWGSLSQLEVHPKRSFFGVTLVFGLMFMSIIFIEAYLRRGWVYFLSIVGWVGFVIFGGRFAESGSPLWVSVVIMLALWVIVVALAVWGYRIFGQIQLNWQGKGEDVADD